MHAGLMLLVSALSADPGPPPPPPPPPPPSAPLEPAPQAQPNGPPQDGHDRGPAIAITIDSNRPGAELFEVVTGEVMTWGIYGPQRLYVSRNHRICREPCRGVLTGSNADFMIAGDGIVESNTFTLAGEGKAVTLHVDAGSSALRGLGKFGVIFGSIVTGIGTLSTLYFGLRGDSSSALFGSIGIAGVGLAALVAGIFLMVTNNTTVHIEPFTGDAPPPPPPGNGQGPTTM